MSQSNDALAQDILYIIPQIMRILTVELRRTGQLMTPGNFQLMIMLQEGPSNLSELAEFQNVSLPTMSRSVSRLEKIGWIERLSDPSDRRVTLIAITEDGQKHLKEISDLAQQTLGELIQSATDKDRETLSAGLDVMRKTFDLYEVEKEQKC